MDQQAADSGVMLQRLGFAPSLSHNAIAASISTILTPPIRHAKVEDPPAYSISAGIDCIPLALTVLGLKHSWTT